MNILEGKIEAINVNGDLSIVTIKVNNTSFSAIVKIGRAHV